MLTSELVRHYTIAHLVLTVLLIFIPTLGSFIAAVWKCRRHNDPARTAFSYLKFALGFYTLYCLLDVCVYGIDVANTYIYLEGISNSTVLEARFYFVEIAELSSRISDILVFLTLLRLSCGIIHVRSGTPDPFAKVLKVASYGIAFVLLAFGIVVLGMDISRHIDNDSYKLATTKMQIAFSFRAIAFALSVLVLGRAIMVKVGSRSQRRVSMASTVLIVSSALWFVRCLYAMVVMVSINDLSNAFKGRRLNDTTYLILLEVFFSLLPQCILLIPLVVLGWMKRNGLWSTAHPFMGGDDTQQTPWGYGYSTVQIMEPASSYQQPQELHVQYQKPPQELYQVTPMPHEMYQQPVPQPAPYPQEMYQPPLQR